jgi:hypothetical protein
MEKPDSAILFPGKEVCGLFIRPWTLAQACALSPTLDALFGMARKEGIGEILWKFMDDLPESPEGDRSSAYKALFGKAQKEVATAFVTLLPKVLPHSPKIIAATITEPLFDENGFVIGINPEGMRKANALDLVQSKEVLLEILVQNWEYVKNSFGPAKPAKKRAS